MLPNVFTFTLQRSNSSGDCESFSLMPLLVNLNKDYKVTKFTATASDERLGLDLLFAGG